MEFRDLCKDPQFFLKLLVLILILANTMLLEDKAPVLPHYTHEVVVLAVLLTIIVLPIQIYDYAIESGQWDTMYLFMLLITVLNLIGSIMCLISYFQQLYPLTIELEMTVLCCLTFLCLAIDYGFYLRKNTGLFRAREAEA